MGNAELIARADQDARFSECRRYRYRLWRYWDRSLPPAVFVMMNPSTADEINNDPTVERCQRRVGQWVKAGRKFGGIEVVNVFAWRDTYSDNLRRRIREGIDIIGPDNDAAILDAVKGAGIVVCAWGATGNLLERGYNVMRMLRAAGVVPHALTLTQAGTPGHPLYIAYDVQPFQYPA